MFVLLVTTLTLRAQQDQTKALGLFEAHQDIGNPELTGTVKFDDNEQVYTVESSGENMWFDRDQFHYLYKKLSGDFILRTRAGFIGDGEDPHRKMGWTVRTDLDPASAHVNAAVHGDGLTSLQYRRVNGDATGEVKSTVEGAEVIQLERRGNRFIMSAAQFGEEFTTVEVTNIDLGEKVYVGLYVCAHNPDIKEKANFSNVRIIKPAADTLIPYQDYLGSNLEVMEVKSGQRKILHQSGESLQAPNWTPNSSKLIYNHNGLLYNYNLAKNRPEILDTDFAINNNNDHVLTFDGNLLGISDHTEHPDGASLIYTLPADGGKPRRITKKGPSYLHGWSPDNQFLVYTGGRNGNYDIYKISADGGEEIRLTTDPKLDDGSEYSPDGKYIYFNSARSGSMEIWRMKPDGSEKEQITNDHLNNWFPHISPDGKQVVFLSYPESIDPEDHPFYKQVYLRLMPIDGGIPKVIGYLYGGQGTINVPSWSPDGNHIAFVSNSGEISDENEE